jgi:hypothetical protein
MTGPCSLRDAGSTAARSEVFDTPQPIAPLLSSLLPFVFSAFDHWSQETKLAGKHVWLHVFASLLIFLIAFATADAAAGGLHNLREGISFPQTVEDRRAKNSFRAE